MKKLPVFFQEFYDDCPLDYILGTPANPYWYFGHTNKSLMEDNKITVFKKEISVSWHILEPSIRYLISTKTISPKSKCNFFIPEVLFIRGFNLPHEREFYTGQDKYGKYEYTWELNISNFLLPTSH